MKDKEKNKIINLLFLGYLIIYFLISLFSKIDKFNIQIINNIIVISNILIETLINNLLIIIIFIIYKKFKGNEYKNQLSKIDLENEGNYYRNILKGYSPFLLSYIDNFEFDRKRDIIASILNLEIKKKIKIQDEKIYIINKEEKELEKCEKYLLNSIKNGKIEIDNISKLEELIQEDAKEKKLIEIYESKKNKKNHINIYINIIILIIVMIVLVYLKIKNATIFNIVLAVITILTFGIILNPIFLIIVYFIRKSFKDRKKIRRTKKGEELNVKLEGLKNYIKDYGRLEEKKHNELIIWEEYLIYSILFDKNNELYKKIKTKII